MSGTATELDATMGQPAAARPERRAQASVERQAPGDAGRRVPADPERRGRIINRLRRLEGQVRGLQAMVREERECREVLTLLSGIRSALDATGDLILEQYLDECACEPTLDAPGIVQAVRLLRK